jgi:NADH dehydrogenase [ubiquinone] 1 alpha subcomplex assembly factor 7
MTPLEKHLISLIGKQGPITVAQFMQSAVSDKHLGYYSQKDPFGAGGDFVTAPEISQMFGELVGVWCAHFWQQMGSPPALALVELGPGRGTLMKDLLRGTQHLKAFQDALQIHMVETSPFLREVQQEKLHGSAPLVTWYENFSSVPEMPLIVIANEFFDALPIHQFIKTEKGWREKLVVVDGGGNLGFALAPEETPACRLIPAALAKGAAEGSTYEASPLSASIIRQIAQRVDAFSGAALIVDYGYDQTPHKDTLQAVSHHQYHPVLEDIGNADLTAHVDFSALEEAAREAGVKTYPVITQGGLLGALGIHFRANALMQRARPEQQEAILAELVRLTDREQMGMLFKCLAFTKQGLKAPIGFL